MSTSLSLLCLVVLAGLRETMSIDCVNVVTSEGLVTMTHGQAACAPLLDGETKAADEGKRFVICSYGRVITQSCPSKLRYQVRYGICHWPEMRDCNIPGIGTDETTIAAPTTSRSSITTSAKKTSLQLTPPTTALPKIASTQRASNAPTHVTKSQTSIKPLATTKIPKGSTTQNLANAQTKTERRYTTKTPIAPTTQGIANTQTITDTRYRTTSPRKSTTRITQTPSTAATTTTPWLTTISKAVPATPNIDLNSQTSTRAPSTSYSATTRSRTPTPDNGIPSGTTNPPEYNDPCKWETCNLPNCSCYGAQPNISLEDTPMFILLTLDGPMTSQLYKSYYEPKMVDNSYRLFNQNGCPFRSTVFLAGAGTDYSSVATLATSGHEIASGTLTDSLPLGFSEDDYNDTVKEIDGLRKKVLQEAKSQELHDSIVGFRAPFLKTAFDVQFEVLTDNGFLYDSSISNIEIYSARNPVWPYTMDFEVVQCPNPPCPTEDYPGLWEIPLNGWLGEDGQSCNYVESCTVGAGSFDAGEEDWYNLFKNNFETYFYPVKAPMHISLRTSTPTENQPLEQAMARWLADTLSSYKNVWLVTHKMVLDWMRDPLLNSQMVAQKWGC